MPIHMGNKTYSKFRHAVAAVKRKKNIRNPEAYVAAIERKEHGSKHLAKKAAEGRRRAAMKRKH